MESFSYQVWTCPSWTKCSPAQTVSYQSFSLDSGGLCPQLLVTPGLCWFWCWWNYIAKWARELKEKNNQTQKHKTNNKQTNKGKKTPKPKLWKEEKYKGHGIPCICPLCGTQITGGRGEELSFGLNDNCCKLSNPSFRVSPSMMAQFHWSSYNINSLIWACWNGLEQSFCTHRDLVKLSSMAGQLEVTIAVLTSSNCL